MRHAGIGEANLARDEANERYAQSEADRYSSMLAKGLVSKEQAEQFRASAEAVSAAVSDSVEDDKTASWYYKSGGSQRSIVLGIERRQGTNTIEVTHGVKRLLPTFRAELPPSVDLDILCDRSDTIRESFHDVQFTMALTLSLVVMVIFLFLRNLSAHDPDRGAGHQEHLPVYRGVAGQTDALPVV